MKTFDSYELLMTPLSPIHIGTGESYEPTNYVMEGDTLHEFDTGSVLDALSATDRTKILEIASGRPDAEMVKAMQRFFHERRETLMVRAVHRIPVLEGVSALYRERVGQTAQRALTG